MATVGRSAKPGFWAEVERLSRAAKKAEPAPAPGPAPAEPKKPAAKKAPAKKAKRGGRKA